MVGGEIGARPLREADFPGARALLERHVREKDIAGAVLAVAIGDAEPAYVSVGETGFGSGRPVDPHSLHRLYSQTKPVTGVAIMMLIEEGRLGLDQPVAEILPALSELKVLDGGAVRAARRQPTVRDLLTHTSGMSYHLQASPLAAMYREAGLQPGVRIAEHHLAPVRHHTLTEMVETLGGLPLGSDPGEAWEYSLSIDVLGAVIEAVCGQGLDAFFEERIFTPLGMEDTSFVVPGDKLGRLTHLHQREADGSWRVVDDPVCSAYARPALLSGGGGLVSTAADYIRFSAMLAGEGATRGVRLLKPETARLARSNLIAQDVQVQISGFVLAGVGFGAAMQVQLAPTQMPAGVFGWGGAAGTGLWVDPIHRLHIVLMTQYMPAEINQALRVEPAIAAYADLGLWPSGAKTRLA